MKLKNHQASLTSQDTKEDAKAIYTLESISLKRKEKGDEEERRLKHSGTKGTIVHVLVSSETNLSFSCSPGASLNSSTTSKT